MPKKRKCVICGKEAEYGMTCNSCHYGKGLDAISHYKLKKKNSYDINDPMDLEMVLDQPFSQLNKKGRKAKRKKIRR